jgi:hypothetical protein
MPPRAHADAHLRGKAIDPLRAVFLARSTKALSAIADRLGPSELAEATASPTNAAVLVAGLLQPGTIGLLREQDPLGPALVRGVQRREALLAAEGGVLGVADVAKRLHMSRQAVNKRRGAGQLLAVEVGRRGFLYPGWQLTDTGTLAGLADVLAALGEASPWAALRFFLSGSHRLSGKRPLDLLRAGKLEPVVRAAKAFDDHGAA